MGRFVDWLQTVAIALGAPGLFLVAVIDSSFVPLPEVVDLQLIYMVTQHPARMVIYATAATLGSIAGCLVLYFIGRKGDEWVARRFSQARIDKAMASFQRYGIMAVLIPSLLPPPAPFKIFVLLAGIAGISVRRFVAAIAIGRGIRYFGEALLAIYYGERAITYLRENSQFVGLTLAGLLAGALAAYILVKRLRRTETPIH
jgi:membrane protein YqaA with SNARE-associated domain